MLRDAQQARVMSPDGLLVYQASASHPGALVVTCHARLTLAPQHAEARLGCQGPNQTKFFSRCGMGPCQGRVCGNAVTQVLAAELGKPPAEVGAYRIRAPIKPVPLEALARLDVTPTRTRR